MASVLYILMAGGIGAGFKNDEPLLFIFVGAILSLFWIANYFTFKN